MLKPAAHPIRHRFVEELSQQLLRHLDGLFEADLLGRRERVRLCAGNPIDDGESIAHKQGSSPELLNSSLGLIIHPFARSARIKSNTLTKQSPDSLTKWKSAIRDGILVYQQRCVVAGSEWNVILAGRP